MADRSASPCTDLSAEHKVLADHIVERVLTALQTPSGPDESAGPSAIRADQMGRYQQIFDLFDIDGGGTLDRSEMGFAMLQLSGREPNLAELDALLDTYDTDGDGEIDISEFANLIVALGLHHATSVDESALTPEQASSHGPYIVSSHSEATSCILYIS
jgi:hypothetical protein